MNILVPPILRLWIHHIKNVVSSASTILVISQMLIHVVKKRMAEAIKHFESHRGSHWSRASLFSHVLHERQWQCFSLLLMFPNSSNISIFWDEKLSPTPVLRYYKKKVWLPHGTQWPLFCPPPMRRNLKHLFLLFFLLLDLTEAPENDVISGLQDYDNEDININFWGLWWHM